MSGACAAEDERLLFENAISAVLCVNDYESEKAKQYYTKRHIRYLYLRTRDDGCFAIHKHFDQAYAFVMQTLSAANNVLVHCAAGMSRSATIVTYVLNVLMRYLYEHDSASVRRYLHTTKIVSPLLSARRDENKNQNENENESRRDQSKRQQTGGEHKQDTQKLSDMKDDTGPVDGTNTLITQAMDKQSIFELVYRYVRWKRPVVSPEAGFLKQLRFQNEALRDKHLISVKPQTHPA